MYLSSKPVLHLSHESPHSDPSLTPTRKSQPLFRLKHETLLAYFSRFHLFPPIEVSHTQNKMHQPDASSSMSLDTPVSPQGHQDRGHFQNTSISPESPVHRAMAVLMSATTHECCLCLSLTQLISHRDEGTGKVSFLFVVSPALSSVLFRFVSVFVC